MRSAVMRKRSWIIAGAAAVAVAAGAVTAGLVLTSSAPEITSRGSIEVDTSIDIDAPSASQDPCEGSQAVITAPDGSVIATAELQTGDASNLGNLGNLDFSTTYTWTAKVSAESRYGIQACGSTHGTVWETPAQMRHGPSLDLDLAGG
jgi:hypothetical protein